MNLADATGARSGGAERERLLALQRYGVLDTAPEPAFDRISQLAASLLDVPIALVSLIDSDRQWFKSRHGLEATETSREVAFCDHAIRGSDLLVVPDAEQDPRFRDNPLVTGDPGVRFYAGAPLITPDGQAIGTLCAIDRKPRALDARGAAILRSLADQVMHELEVRTALGELYREVAEGRRAARTLRGVSLQLEALLNATGNAVLTADADGHVVSVNRATQQMFGLQVGKAIGLPVEFLLPGLRLPAPEGAGPGPVELMGRRADGSEFPVELSLASWPDEGGRQATGLVLRDVTERRKAETAARAQEKMVALGRVAGGVAHEINNLLQPVVSLSELVRDQLPDEGEMSEAREHLAMVLDCGWQMRAIVQKILQFARQDTPQLQLVEVAGALRRAVDFVRSLLPPAVALQEDVPELPGSARLNESDLKQVITNLAVNAAHAMGGRGEVTVRLALEELTPEQQTALSLPAGRYFAISASDHGAGMDEATKARIFEPFFTTKPVGEGTGLGMSAVYGLLRRWKGGIGVESSPGHGATITLFIPEA